MDDNAPIAGGDAASGNSAAPAPVAPAFPENAAGYSVRLPGDFKFPEGYEARDGESPINFDDPRIAAARDFAHANKMTQDQFEAMLSLGAQHEFAEQTQFREAIARQVELLGPKAQARIGQVKTWITSKLPEHQAQALLGTLFSKDQVEAYETLMRLNRGDVPGTPGAARQAGSAGISDEEWNKMSVGDRLAYARSHSKGR